VAWKNGTFSFSNANLQTVMRELARWYNIEVEYTGDASYGAFTGEIGRTLTLDQVLKGLTKTRVHYKIEKNNKLLIQP
jgi:ferric-dicitrate binding protein FerR (iron transport regulator)